MKYGIYGYRDNKFCFGPIWNDPNDEVAIRGFSMMMNNGNSIMGFAPADFDLFKIGEFDSETGQVDSIWPIQFICNGRAVITPKFEERNQDNEKSECKEKD